MFCVAQQKIPHVHSQAAVVFDNEPTNRSSSWFVELILAVVSIYTTLLNCKNRTLKITTQKNVRKISLKKFCLQNIKAPYILIQFNAMA